MYFAHSLLKVQRVETDELYVEMMLGSGKITGMQAIGKPITKGKGLIEFLRVNMWHTFRQYGNYYPSVFFFYVFRKLLNVKTLLT